MYIGLLLNKVRGSNSKDQLSVFSTSDCRATESAEEAAVDAAAQLAAHTASNHSRSVPVMAVVVDLSLAGLKPSTHDR